MADGGTSGLPLRWIVAALGVAGLIGAVAASPSPAGAAAAQDWSPFVLVSGLLLIGLVANDDGLFAAAGQRLAGVARNGATLFVGATLMVAVVTAVLNLDTSVAFLTPVLVHTARSRRAAEAPLVYGCLLLSNAASLFLPGSNLTNLIVINRLHLSGSRFLTHMWAPALAALVVTAAVIALMEHRALRAPPADPSPPQPAVLGLGLGAVALAALLVVLVGSPALPVAAVGVAAAGLRVVTGKLGVGQASEALPLPLLVGLFGIAVALGTLGRDWAGPTTLLSHLDLWGTAAAAAAASILFNNLPAASLLAARPPAHPFSLLIGLNLGPNLFVTGSLAWLLWLRAAGTAGARPSLRTASRLGLVVVPLSLAAALGALALTGST